MQEFPKKPPETSPHKAARSAYRVRGPLATAGLALIVVLGMSLAWQWRYAPPPSHTDAALPAPCRPLTFEGDDYVVCELPRGAYAVSLAHAKSESSALSTVPDFVAARAANDAPPVLAMNAGMYHLDLSPLGLLVADGVQVAALNLGDGRGNFYLKPNGVFFIADDGTAGIMESTVYAEARPAARQATQSGPLLVQKHALHPAFDANGRSRYRRNGVGVRDDRTIVLVISRDEVSFGALARLFRDELHCRDALYLDGAVSALAGADGAVIGGTFPAGPIIVVEQHVDTPAG